MAKGDRLGDILKGQGCVMRDNLNRVDVVHWRAD